MMKKLKSAANPEAYVKALKGWRRELVKEAVKLNRSLADPTELS